MGGEAWNSGAKGTWPLDLIIQRWQKARCYGSSYLAVGDGAHHIQTEYFPDTTPINEADIDKIRDHVFSTPCSMQLPTWCRGQNHNSYPWFFWLSCTFNLLLVITLGVVVNRILATGDSEPLCGRLFGSEQLSRFFVSRPGAME